MREVAPVGRLLDGLKKVPDSGIEGYKRYVALGVLGYNIHKLGAILLERRYKQMKKNTA